MPDFVYIKCPNCKVKIKIDKEKKYHDCPDCKYEFRLEEVENQLTQPGTTTTTAKESIFGKFMKENKLN